MFLSFKQVQAYFRCAIIRSEFSYFNPLKYEAYPEGLFL
jgi:hypothetical protein